jgi:hypothetical protein
MEPGSEPNRHALGDIVTNIVKRDLTGKERTPEDQKQLSDLYFAAKLIAQIFTGEKGKGPLSELVAARKKLHSIYTAVDDKKTAERILDAIVQFYPSISREQFLGQR